MTLTLLEQLRSRATASAIAVALAAWSGCGYGVSEDPLQANGNRPGSGSNGGEGGDSNGASGATSGSGGAGRGGSGGRASSAGRGGTPGASGSSGAGAGGSGKGGNGSGGEVQGDSGQAGDREAGGQGGEAAHAGQGGEAAYAGQGGEAAHAGQGGQGGQAGGEPRICASDAPFGPPRRVRGLPNLAVRLRLNPDETIGYYALWSPTNNYELYAATRETRSSSFGPGEPLAINTPDWFFSPTVDANRTVLYFENNSSGRWLIYESPWDETKGRFENVFFANGINSLEEGGINGGPYAVPNGKALYFHTGRDGGQLLAKATRNGDAFQDIEVFAYLGRAGAPVVAPDELTLYASVCAPPEGTGQCDIRVATRASKADAFGEFVDVIGVNTAGNEVPSFISADGCRLYFDRNSGLPFGWGRSDDTAYVVEREPSD